MNFFIKRTDTVDDYTLLENAITLLNSASYSDDIKEALKKISNISKKDPVLVGTRLQEIIYPNVFEFGEDSPEIRDFICNILNNILSSPNGKEFSEIILKNSENVKAIASINGWNVLHILYMCVPEAMMDCVLKSANVLDEFVRIKIENLDLLIDMSKNEDFCETLGFRDGFEQIFSIMGVLENAEIKNDAFVGGRLINLLLTLLQNQKNQSLFLELKYLEFLENLDDHNKLRVYNSLLNSGNKNFAQIQNVLSEKIDFENAISKGEFELIYKLIYSNPDGLGKAFKSLAAGQVHSDKNKKYKKDLKNIDSVRADSKTNYQYKILVLEQLNKYFEIKQPELGKEKNFQEILIYWKYGVIPNLDIKEIRRDLLLISGKNKGESFLVIVCILLADKLDMREDEIGSLNNIACSNRTIDILRSLLSLLLAIDGKILSSDIFIHKENIKKLRNLLFMNDICINDGLKEFIFRKIDLAIEKIDLDIDERIMCELKKTTDENIGKYNLNGDTSRENIIREDVVKKELKDDSNLPLKERSMERFKTFFKNISFAKDKKDRSYEM